MNKYTKDTNGNLNGQSATDNPLQQQPPFTLLLNFNGVQPQLNFMAARGGGKKIIQLEHKPYELVDGRARVTFSKEEDALLAEKCKMVVAENFSCTRPQIYRLREEFK